MTAEGRKLAVVTGASSGIGYSLAKIFAESGCDLVVVSETADIEKAAGDFEQFGVTVTPLQTDLAQYEGVEEVGMTLEKLDRAADFCAINAGIGVSGDFTRDLTLEENLKLIDLNVTSCVHLAKIVLLAMVARNEGKVMFTSSIAGVLPGPYEATYAASKAFIYSFGEALRYELRDTGVTVTVLMPGPTNTAFFERAGLLDTKLGQSEKDNPDDVARDGYEAMMAGVDHVIAGSMKNKLQVMSAKVTPIDLLAKQHGSMTEPGSGEES